MCKVPSPGSCEACCVSGRLLPLSPLLNINSCHLYWESKQCVSNDENLGLSVLQPLQILNFSLLMSTGPHHPGDYRAPRPLFGTHKNLLMFVAFGIRMCYNLGHYCPANPGKYQENFLKVTH